MSRPLAFLLAAAALVALSCREQIRFDDLAAAPCQTDPDCLLPSMHCNSGTCVACTTDAHCTAPGFPRCDLALHRCVECGVTADCGTGRVCHTGHCATPCTAGVTTCPTSAPICDDMMCAQCDDGKGCAGSPAGPVCVGHCWKAFAGVSSFRKAASTRRRMWISPSSSCLTQSTTPLTVSQAFLTMSRDGI